MIKVIEFKKLKSGKKKYEIIFEKNGKKYTRKFGAAGASDYTIHKDKDRRERYISRHKKDLRTNDPMKPGYLSMYILWNKPTVTTSLADYKRRLNIYNKTGKFPTEIKGSKKLSSFGAPVGIIPRKGTMLDKLPDDVFNIIEEDVVDDVKRRLRKELPKFTARPFNVPARGLGPQNPFVSFDRKEESRKAKVKLMYVLKELRRKSLKESQPGRAYTDPSTVPISLARTMSEQQKEAQVNYANYFNDITSNSGSIITKELSKLVVSEFKYRQNLWWYLVYKGLQLYLNKLIELRTVSEQPDQRARVHNSGYHLIDAVRKVCATQPLGRGPCANRPSAVRGASLHEFSIAEARWVISVWEDSSSFEIPHPSSIPPSTFNFRPPGASASYAERLLARPSPLTPQELAVVRRFLARRAEGASTEDASYDDLDQTALSFGVSSIIPRKGTRFDNLPDDIFMEMFQKPRSAQLIQKNVREKQNRHPFRPTRQTIINKLKNVALENFYKHNNPKYLKDLIINYDIHHDSAVRITEDMVEILKQEDFRQKSFWWKLVLNGLQQIKGMYSEINGPFLTSSDFFNNEEYLSFEANEELLIELVNIGTGMYYDDRHEDPYWTNRIIYAWNNEVDNNSFGKKQSKKSKGSKIPDNVVNKALYARIKAKIRKDVNKKKRRWGAYDSGRLVREYKAKGGKYSGGKGKTNLGRWYKEKWVDACAWPKRKSCGRKTKEKIAYCRPSKKVDSKTPKLVQDLTKAQIKSRCAKKKRSPMKRVTKFGTIDIGEDSVAVWDGKVGAATVGRKGDFIKHCTFQENVGPHITIRYKPPDFRRGGSLDRPDKRLRMRPEHDISWHFGMFKNQRGRLLGPTLWYGRGNAAANLNIIPPAPLMCELVFGYNECVDKFITDYDFSSLGENLREAKNRLKGGRDFKTPYDSCIRRERNQQKAALIVQARYRGGRDRDWFLENKDNLRVTRQAERIQKAIQNLESQGFIRESLPGAPLAASARDGINTNAPVFVPSNNNFGSHFSLNFYKSLMKSSKDVQKLANVLRQQLELRCGKIKSSRCNKILIELYLNIFYAIKKLKISRKERQTKIQKDIETEIVKLKNKHKIVIDKTFIVNKTDLPKIKKLLYLLQDDVLDYTMDVAYLSSYITAYM